MAPVALIEHTDLITSAIAFGFTTGFGVLTAWEVIKQTMRARSPLRSVYIWLCWVELLVCFILSLILLFMLGGAINVGLGLLIIIMVGWAIKLHCVIQIICNRVALILPDRRKAAQLKWGMFAAVMVLVVLGFTFWIPAQLQLEPYRKINHVVERVIKVSYLIVDSGLNFVFVRIVKRRLVEMGLAKYERIVRFNVRIIFISIGMDLLIIGTMNMSNPLVYTQFHPLGFIVKLRIELALAELIRKIATQQTSDMISSSDDIGLSRRMPQPFEDGRYNIPLSTTTAISHSKSGAVKNGGDLEGGTGRSEIVVETMVRVEHDSDTGSTAPPSRTSGTESVQRNGLRDDDVEPLNESWRRQA